MLHRLDVEVLALPTVLLSNHPGHPHCSGVKVGREGLVGMLGALDQNGKLSNIDAIATGYLPTPEHVAFAVETVALTRNRSSGAIYLCDPIMGDDPGGLYLDQRAAHALATRLVPIADIVTPNRFELASLSQRKVGSVAEAVAAAQTLERPVVLATSIPSGREGLANLLVEPRRISLARADRLERVPHGTGDALAALFLKHWLEEPSARALASAAGMLAAIIDQSRRCDDLDLTGDWAEAGCCAVETLA